MNERGRQGHKSVSYTVRYRPDPTGGEVLQGLGALLIEVVLGALTRLRQRQTRAVAAWQCCHAGGSGARIHRHAAVVAAGQGAQWRTTHHLGGIPALAQPASGSLGSHGRQQRGGARAVA